MSFVILNFSSNDSVCIVSSGFVPSSYLQLSQNYLELPQLTELILGSQLHTTSTNISRTMFSGPCLGATVDENLKTTTRSSHLNDHTYNLFIIFLKNDDEDMFNC